MPNTGKRDHGKHHDRRDRERARPALEDPGPAPEPALVDRLRRAELDLAAVAAEQRGQQRERAEHRGEHGQRRGNGRAVEERDAEQQHAEQRDHDGRAGEQHRAPGGVERVDGGLADVLAAPALAAEAVEDQQRVVDPDAEGDHHRQGGGEARDVEHRGRREHDRHGHADAGERHDQRHAHRGQRAEHDDQDEDRHQHADALGCRLLRLLGDLDCLSAEVDLQPGVGGALGRVDHTLDVGLVEVACLLVERDRGEPDRAVLADRRPAPHRGRARRRRSAGCRAS